MPISRRRVLASLAAGAATWVAGCATTEGPRVARRALGRVVVVGGGYGGATAAKYLRAWSDGAVDVVLVEREAAFVSCPVSNLVLGGTRRIQELTRGYGGLKELGVQVVKAEVQGIDGRARSVRLSGGETLRYDRLVLSPGVDLQFDEVQGFDHRAQMRIMHAWKAGPQTVTLRRQLEAMRDGGVVVITVPRVPFRCPPGPYERACQIAFYLKNAKPRSKVVILDANEEVQSKKPLFLKVWAEQYRDLIEYRNSSEVKEVDASTLTAVTDFGDKVRADVLNLIPPMRAADIARTTQLVNANDKWCMVDWMSMESTAVPGIHVLGDATLAAPVMPKSGHMANQHGKAAAAAIIELLAGRPARPTVMANTCYSFVDDRQAIHVASVHRYDPDKKVMEPVPGAGGLSAAPSAEEGRFAWSWAQNIWADMLT